MTLLPVIILLGITVMIGLFMGQRAWRGVPNNPVMIGFHVLLGAAAFEPLVVALQKIQVGSAATGSYGTATFLLVGLTLISGVVRSLVIKQSPALRTPLLAVHATLAATALALAVILAVKLA
jgi:hypothetical protein